ncbi:metalloprotease [Enterococcus sp. PF-2]|uniref:Neutral zinc metallopeptidase n=1 Tax=Enterococcus entomosocium TaxID=3034352 RepID=A0ABV3M8P2_9ENTE|nr:MULTISPECIES: neutral zinc metallopeptidase [Enterococcus]EPH59854.1 putative neutral zinc metallopeptidase [Enterococcus faecium 13.SD.W.09]MBV6372271.1 zinc metallopeptidase [Enterococcus casseliflavus]MDB1709927.1 zinc metallopeptidase [Enterococcus casseliflavus]MDB1716098.1 zinc metallopeptidase [Enterococcus casseliflavus]MEC5314145.1 zinc metallopeptidase [Enterococcus casseliflavus]
MKWRGGRQSSNVDDRTGRSSGSGGMLAAGGGIGTVIIAVLFFLFSGGDLNSLPDVLGGSGQAANYQTENVGTSEYTEEKEFSAVVFGYLEDYWQDVFQERQETYQDPTLVLFTGSVQSACGYATSQVGPFYCPADENVYLDLSFANELSDKYGASGDFAMAYVIAHEVGHHVQNELGITQQLEKIRQQVSEKEYNQYSVRLELQADYLAGTFAKYLQGETYQGQPILEAGDIQEAITAANAIGDDTLQKEYQGYVVPDSFTHGTSQQRVDWFNRGYRYGDLAHGDTFNVDSLDLSK